jgi:hypothetical protein
MKPENRRRATTHFSKSGQEKPLDAVRHDTGKLMPIDATPIIATPQEDNIFSVDEPWDGI